MTQTGGAITAKGGSVTIDSNAIHQTGIVDVSDIGDAGSVTINANTLYQSGTVKADSSHAKGGTVTYATRKHYVDTQNAVTDVSGKTGGGSMAIGQIAGSKATGTVYSSGTLKANSSHAKGGNITMTGEQVRLVHSTITADGATGGGKIKVGGAYQGGAGVAKADEVLISPGTTLSANATNNGNGGRDYRLVRW